MDTREAWSTFADKLRASQRVLCLVGAGLSAPSGLDTWRGSNGLWNDINLRDLASPNKFFEDPVTVWTFYGERLVKTLAAQPNLAHHALAALATGHEGWLTINQNVDGLLEQTEHPMTRLLGIHGTLRTIRCTSCNYNTRIESPSDVPFLLLLSTQLRSVTLSDLPRCPVCTKLLRPGVVWFGEMLAAGAPDTIDDWISQDDVDLVIAVGTSLEVYPATEWVEAVRESGASLAIINTEKTDRLVDELNDDDWFFEGDAADILPRILDLVTYRHHAKSSPAALSSSVSGACSLKRTLLPSS
ncbi:DHS-like NAD/FAD-binding domain-containing protein [Cucurbitaria berberidis CBS 394.84]|uniref:DHS-like NAD/FAD-binding domain-containing protein n=1 Tax=Cucurbitaria berberidis CBS 394.84 TaxID=1168544 RepID=A0A9P4GV47_9PLEO|nr:DHS-like NAD/FAD-binding domain-containing protein [Cucurbitaria berberidis CBS 394.84]KAF1852121.1 DHS-like NAD/FAD-binding domain-containing protein [Cucurbitaria berberidis CBS 394.84]